MPANHMDFTPLARGGPLCLCAALLGAPTPERRRLISALAVHPSMVDSSGAGYAEDDSGRNDRVVAKPDSFRAAATNVANTRCRFTLAYKAKSSAPLRAARPALHSGRAGLDKAPPPGAPRGSRARRSQPRR